MDDLDMLARDFGFGARGKSNPMRSAQSDRRPINGPSFSDVFGEPAKFTPSSNSDNNKQHSSMRDFDYDSIFNSSEASEAKKTNNSSSSKMSSFPVYDKPVYDEDIFDGLPGLKSKSTSSTVRHDNDVFGSISSQPSSKSRNQNNDFDDLLGNLGRSEKAGENIRSSSAKSSASSKGFDDLLGGFGSGISAASNRPITESNWGSMPIGGLKHGSVLDDPFVVPESASTQGSSSSRVFADPLEEISKHGASRSARAEASSGGGRGFDDLDPLNSFGKPANSFSPGRDKMGKEGSPSRSASPQSATTREQMGSSAFGYFESNMKKTPVDHFQEPPLFHVPNVFTDFQKSSDQTVSSQYVETSSQVHTSPTSSGPGQQSDDVWLTVLEIPLLTQPTAAPPPSRPPPPIPRQTSRPETRSFTSSSRRKGDEFSSPSNHSQRFQSPKPVQPVAEGPQASRFDELEDFALGRSQNSVDESANLHYSEETNAFSAAAASAAAMKEAMEKAEAKFRHAKEVREREYAKAARHKESVQLEKDAQDGQGRDLRETEEILEHERNQREEEERELRRLQRERERSRDIEREKARQAVERANREARERAAVQARERAAAEARLKAERAAVGKASAEARERAERVAVQRAQAEARERAAAEAKERAEKAATEAKERVAAAEAREKELREASLARAEAEARRRAERAAVERAAAEARERAAAEARERAAAATAAKMNQQRNDDDLESFFSMGRASSAPRGHTNSTDPFFDQPSQNKGGSEAGKRASSSSGASSNMEKASSTTNMVDDLSSIFGAPPAGEFQEVDGETEERRRARLERHQRTQERAAKALAEKNQRDLQAQREQEERHRIAETLDIEIKRWAAGREGNLRALLSTLQYVLWPECGWQPVSLTDLITGAAVKKVYRKATLCIHPDKVQQKGATLQQKYIAEKVFDLLKEAWNKFNSEELF